MTTSVLMVGVGGQGIVLAGNVLARAALNNGMDVKKSEIHGMAQRGGSVVSHVRFGDKVFASSIPLAGADFILSFEKMEYLRYLNYMNDKTTLLLASKQILPPSVSLGTEAYPEAVADDERKRFYRKYTLDADSAAVASGNEKTAGIVMLGALSLLLDISETAWKEAISQSVPEKILPANQKAFQIGRTLID